MTHLAVLADDLTGATDVGAACLRQPVRSQIAALPQAAEAALASDAKLVIVNTQSRLLPPDSARERLAAISRLAADRGLLKKTDSALRGPLGAELDAVLTASGADRLVFLPAYPEAGRTTVGGVHRIHGVPVADSEFGRDPVSPVTESAVVALLRQTTRRPVRLTPVQKLSVVLGQPGEGELLVVEAETAAQVAEAASVLAGHDLPAAGPAGFLQALLAHRLPAEPKPEAPAAGGPLLLLCGSLHPASRRQLSAAVHAGFAAFGADAASEAVVAALRRHEPIMVATAAEPEPADHLSWLAQLAQDVVANLDGRPLRLALTGGETAFAVLSALGWSVLTPFAEPEPGACWSTVAGREDQVFTKSGAFGSEGLLAGLA